MSRVAEACDPPVFIVGFPRSGTTLMRALLSAHSTIAIGPETHFLNRFTKRAKTFDLETRERFLEFWGRFSRSNRFVDFGIDPALARDRILASKDYHLRNVFATTLREFARAAGKSRWGEKTPGHDRHLATLFEWFPDARAIYMLRDPRAACASLLQAPWRVAGFSLRAGARLGALRRLRILEEDAFYWRRSVERYRQRWQGDPRVISVRYEDLAQQPERTLRRVCPFLAVEFEQQMLDARSEQAFPAAQAQLADKEHQSWRREHIERARQRVGTDSVAKWRSELSSIEVAVIESKCDQEMRAFGYQPLRADSSLGWKARLGRAAAALLLPVVGSRRFGRPRIQPDGKRTAA